jgi:hypothetical protein
LEITATAFADKESVKQVLGSDLGGFIVVVEVRVAPKAGKSLNLVRDDFLLRSDKDGQKSQPFAPSQIAGSGALVVWDAGGGAGGGIMGDNNGPIWGGGPVPMGRPRRMGGDGGSMGNTSETSTQSAVKDGKNSKPDPLLDTLKQKVLPEKETAEPVSGLLYFPLEGKHKLKDLELLYRGSAGKLSIRFR